MTVIMGSVRDSKLIDELDDYDIFAVGKVAGCGVQINPQLRQMSLFSIVMVIGRTIHSESYFFFPWNKAVRV
jgi:hypothetical protein